MQMATVGKGNIPIFTCLICCTHSPGMLYIECIITIPTPPPFFSLFYVLYTHSTCVRNNSPGFHTERWMALPKILTLAIVGIVQYLKTK